MQERVAQISSEALWDLDNSQRATAWIVCVVGSEASSLNANSSVDE
jgi:hypothetical protein